jgi:hypothetical protein
MKARASKATKQQRIEEILSIVLDGAQAPHDLRAFVREKESEEGSVWYLQDGQNPLSDSQIRRYAAEADKLIAESCRASRKKLIRRHRARRENLYAKAVLSGDLRTALAVLRDQAELEALYPPKDAETERRLAAVEKRYAEMFGEQGKDHEQPRRP